MQGVNSDFFNAKPASENEVSLVNPFDSSQKLTIQDTLIKKESEEAYKNILEIVKQKRYEDFISNKDQAFIYYSLKPETKNLFPQEDKTTVDLLMFNYSNSLVQAYTVSCLGTWFADRLLRKKNMIYGLTYQPSSLRFLFKYILIPKIIVGFVRNNFLEGNYQNQIGRIYEKYDFNQDIFRNSYASEIQSPKSQPSTTTSKFA